MQARSAAPAHNTCFEIFGLDVLLDERLRAWLIEANTSPSLGTVCAVDRAVKEPMLASLLHMAGIVPYHRTRLQEEVASAQQVQTRTFVARFGRMHGWLHTAPSFNTRAH